MHPLECQFAEAWDLSTLSGLTTVVAVSGGPDSVALLKLLVAQATRLNDQTSLLVAHFNHGWREAAGGDEQFVRQLASTLGLPVHVERADSCARRSEGMGRSLRYAFLTQIAHQQGARYLLTGHTADDQAETVLFHAVRGTGLRGLCGIPEVRKLDESLSLKRPLLQFTRAQLADYLHEVGQPCRSDATNEDLRFTRNRIRHELMPLIERTVQGDPRLALRRLGVIAREAMDEVQPVIDQAVESAVVSRQAQAVELDCQTLASFSSFVIREAIASLWQSMGWIAGEMTYAKWCELAEMVTDDQEVSVTFPGGVRAIRRSGLLELSRS